MSRVSGCRDPAMRRPTSQQACRRSAAATRHRDIAFFARAEQPRRRPLSSGARSRLQGAAPDLLHATPCKPPHFPTSRPGRRPARTIPCRSPPRPGPGGDWHALRLLLALGPPASAGRLGPGPGAGLSHMRPAALPAPPWADALPRLRLPRSPQRRQPQAPGPRPQAPGPRPQAPGPRPQAPGPRPQPQAPGAMPRRQPGPAASHTLPGSRSSPTRRPCNSAPPPAAPRGGIEQPSSARRLPAMCCSPYRNRRRSSSAACPPCRAGQAGSQGRASVPHRHKGRQPRQPELATSAGASGLNQPALHLASAPAPAPSSARVQPIHMQRVDGDGLLSDWVQRRHEQEQRHQQ
jgi:hypothetical protein